MELTTRQKVGIVAIYTVSAIAVGRYSVALTTKLKKQDTKTQETSQTTDTHKDKAKKTTTTVIETTTKDGTKTKKTQVIVEDKTDLDKNINNTTKNQETHKESLTQVAQVGKWHVSILGGLNVLDPASTGFVYGAAASRDIIGPFNLGLFGLSTGVMGLSAGLNF